MNVIQLAKQQAALEANRRDRYSHERGRTNRGPPLEEGELVWYGDQSDSLEARPSIMTGGDKRPMNRDEQKLFARTPYERGVTEYRYEGTLKRLRPAEDPEDPRAAQREGPGVLRYPNGELFEGSWKNNKRHGEGFLSTPHGYRFTGEWRDDEQEGKGYESLPCKSALDCHFVEGLPEGPGVLMYVPEANQDYRYEGEFRLGYRHGRGTVFYENGDTYVGQWDNGQRHGKGLTTREVNGRPQQYVTEWEQGSLIFGPEAVEAAKRQGKPKSTMKINTVGNIIPADLTKWKTKEDCVDLPMEHFLRIKLGFEKLDTKRNGSLSHSELQAIWGNGSQKMLAKLDADGNGTVELDEIFAAWYPNVSPHNVQRFMSMDVSPKVLLRVRGFLCGVVDENESGFYQVLGVRNMQSLDQEEDKPMTLKMLENAEYKIGLEKFSNAMYEAAKQQCDPPHFLEVMQTWYPMVPKQTLERYDAREIDPLVLDQIRADFFKLSSNEMDIQISDFEDAQEKYQEQSHNHPGTNVISQGAKDGFYHEQPVWQVGPVRLSVQLIKDIMKLDSKSHITGGSVSLPQLVRYCYPNIRCKRTQEVLQGKKTRAGAAPCPCQICSIH